jgi:hypothetical protein
MVGVLVIISEIGAVVTVQVAAENNLVCRRSARTPVRLVSDEPAKHEYVVRKVKRGLARVR